MAKIISKFKLFRGLLITGIIVGVVLSIISFSQFSETVWLGILLIVAGVGAIATSIYFLVKKVNPVIKDTNAKKNEHIEVANQIKSRAFEQMAPLNALFTDEDALRLVEQTIPEISFDKMFTREQERLFVDKYDFIDLQDDDCSMVDTLSGRFSGNPFLFGRRRVTYMGTHTYRGSLVITWTETYRDGQGNVRTRTRSQTLTATVTKPKPYYYTNTFLAYGSQAAPDLTFSRKSKHSEGLSDKALEKRIKKGESKLHKQSAKAIKTGGTFQEMANTEFDVLFDATDRDNEVEFRFMYTPLGQTNTIALLKDSAHYGDDFNFTKHHRMNIISSDHAQKWSMNTSADNYRSFDFDDAYKRFMSFNENFFKSIFFDFAPLLSVPAYLDEPCVALEGEEEYDRAYTSYEHEVLLNANGYSDFVHDSSDTEAILKAQLVSSADGVDTVAVTAYSYHTEDRIDYVSVKGGDGNYHNVPVLWIEYLPVNKTSHVTISSVTPESEGVTYHGMLLNHIN